jgi:hypothetical protein
MDSQCPVSQPVCDSGTNMCRACASGTECPSGVCLDATGTCAAQDDVQYVTENGTDAGTCPKASPCATIAYAISQATGSTKIIHIEGGTYNIADEIDLSTFSGTIDGESTTLTYIGSDSTASSFSISDGNVVFSNLTFGGAQVGVLQTGGAVSLYDVVIGTTVTSEGGTLLADHVTVNGGLGVSNSGAATVQSSTVHGQLGGRDGVLHVEGTLFSGGHMSSLINLTATIVNNVFVSSSGSPQIAFVSSPSATIDFNTFVNTSGGVPAGAAITCAANVSVSDSVFVWGSATPATSCSPTYSLFDTTATLPTGTGNISGDPSQFFTSLSGQNFHLATGSPAIGAGDPASTVTTDFDGNPRPNPAGSHPDIGAFESPQ